MDRMTQSGASPSRAGRHPRARAALSGACATLLLLGSCDSATQPEPEVVCDTPGLVKADGREIPIAPNGFATVGNKIYNGTTCETFRFVGVSRPSLSFSPLGGRLANATETAADLALIKSWKANTVRL